jgi:hypothetical protein
MSIEDLLVYGAACMRLGPQWHGESRQQACIAAIIDSPVKRLRELGLSKYQARRGASWSSQLKREETRWAQAVATLCKEMAAHRNAPLVPCYSEQLTAIAKRAGVVGPSIKACIFLAHWEPNPVNSLRRFAPTRPYKAVATAFQETAWGII